ncbi:MAG: hypothetical protein ACFFE8_11690 [Candidatus Heimdallarchaeota archaeon]
MKEDKIRLLRTILDNLRLSEIPSSMVQRRVIVKTKFDEKTSAFHNPAFIKLYATVLGKGKSFSADSLTSTSIFTFINDNQDLWEAAYQYTAKRATIHDSSVEVVPEEYRATIERNTYEPSVPEEYPFLDSLLDALKTPVSDVIPYPDYEKRILVRLEGVTVMDKKEWIDEGLKAYANVVYGEDAEASHRMFLEDITKHANILEGIGFSFKRPTFMDRGEGKITLMIDAAHAGAQLSRGGLELQRLIRIANKIGSVNFAEEELLEFFSSYLFGELDSILLNPPKGYSYLRDIEQLASLDYTFDVDFSRLGLEVECKPKGLEKLGKKLLNILRRVKFVEWTRNVPLGEEPTLIDLIREIQRNVLKEGTGDEGPLITLEGIFHHSTINVIKASVDYFARRLAYRYLIGIHKGGIERPLRNAFRNLGSAPRGLGNQINAVMKYYKAYYESSKWKLRLWDDFILDLAAKGLVSAEKLTVRERVKLIVQDDPRYSMHYKSTPGQLQLTTEKIQAGLLQEVLRRKVPYISPKFGSSDMAENYLIRAFGNVKLSLNKVWIKKILRAGFQVYIETPVTKVWQDELEDLAREMIRYIQNLSTVGRKSVEMNDLVVEALRDALGALYYVDNEIRDRETNTLHQSLPERPTIVDSESVEAYLDTAFQHSKAIINTVLQRQVDREVEHVTFDEERRSKQSEKNGS